MKRRNLGNYEHKEVTITASLEDGDDYTEAYNLLNMNVNNALVMLAPIPAASTAVVEEKKKAPVKKKAPAKKKAPVKKKEPVVIPTTEELMLLCRETATRLGSADKVKALIQEVCGVGSLKECLDDTCFIELSKKLKDA